MNILRKRRIEARLSQRALAEKAHIAQSAICEYETGKRQLWPKARRQLAKALKTPVNELFPEV